MEYAKWKYSISIVLGILMASVVALFMGNAITAVLAGVLTAGITSWIASLNWAGAEKFSGELACKMSAAGAMKHSHSYVTSEDL